ncbi:hypothetical protein OJAV_G00138050 [Oryzias javanicus]|uniref:Uncharacterized protein n=1 Tax=Oryzias javanicus TaxID=123683 RepID=A0A3S2MP79_ORYJA|nr:hypothetical protein OJAV_G00138050 [Oryzias javanicus]
MTSHPLLSASTGDFEKPSQPSFGAKVWSRPSLPAVFLKTAFVNRQTALFSAPVLLDELSPFKGSLIFWNLDI